MRIVTFEVPTNRGPMERLGAIYANHYIVDLNSGRALYLKGEHASQPQRRADFEVPANIITFLEGGPEAMLAAAEVVQNLDSFGVSRDLLQDPDKLMKNFRGLHGEQIIYHQSQIRILAPIPRPVSIRDFLAFEGHARSGFERRKEPFPEIWNRVPIYYKGNPKSVIGPDTAVTIPYYTQKMDYELEVACVIGTTLRNATVEQALLGIGGYMIMNDFSARDIQSEEVQGRLGPAKGKDFATAFGPWLVTVEEAAGIESCKMEAWINGEKWSEGKLADARWNFAQMISYVSQEETLYPGEIFGSGTCNRGCGLELGKFLKAGDTVRLSIDRLGVLENKLVASDRPYHFPTSHLGVRHE